MKDIRTLTDQELVEALYNGDKVDIPEDCSLEELLKCHERLNSAVSAIRDRDTSAIKAKLDQLAQWRDANIPTQKVIANNKKYKVSVFNFIKGGK